MHVLAARAAVQGAVDVERYLQCARAIAAIAGDGVYKMQDAEDRVPGDYVVAVCEREGRAVPKALARLMPASATPRRAATAAPVEERSDGIPLGAAFGALSRREQDQHVKRLVALQTDAEVRDRLKHGRSVKGASANVMRITEASRRAVEAGAMTRRRIRASWVAEARASAEFQAAIEDDKVRALVHAVLKDPNAVTTLGAHGASGGAALSCLNRLRQLQRMHEEHGRSAETKLPGLDTLRVSTLGPTWAEEERTTLSRLSAAIAASEAALRAALGADVRDDEVGYAAAAAAREELEHVAPDLAERARERQQGAEAKAREAKEAAEVKADRTKGDASDAKAQEDAPALTKRQSGIGDVGARTLARRFGAMGSALLLLRTRVVLFLQARVVLFVRLLRGVLPAPSGA